MEIANVSPSTNDFYSYYTSAPTSPRRCNLNGFIFLSMPTSPSRDPLGSGYGSPMGDYRNLVDNFEFEGSKRFYPCDNVSEKSQELSVAYADELFFDGKVVPLRPPPRVQYAGSERKTGNYSTGSSPGSRSSMVKVPFLRQRSLWNDGYDPFVSALNKIQEENDMVRKSLDKGQLRRAKSLSPLRLAHGSTHLGRSADELLGHIDAWTKEHSTQNMDVVGDISEPKDNMRKQKIKKFLQKNATFVKSEKKEQNVPLLLKKLEYSVRFSSVTTKTIVRVSREMKSLMKHRARIFFCLVKGLATKSSKKLI